MLVENRDMQRKLLLNVMNSNDPSGDLVKLDESGLLCLLLPELTSLKGVDFVDGRGHKENFIHTLQVVKQTSEVTKDPWLILVSILHDIGKAPTKRYDGGNWTFQNHELVGAKMLKGIFKRFELDMSKFEYVYKLVEYHGIAKELTKELVTDSAIRRFSVELGEYVDDLLLFCKCDMTTRFEDKKVRFQNDLDKLKSRIAEVKKNDEKLKWRCPIDGNFIMSELGITPGRKLGLIKSEIERAIKSGDVSDNFDSAYEYLNKIKNNY